MSEFVNVGKLIKTHGLKGDITIRIDNSFEEDFFNTEKIFIEHHGQKIPYFIDDIQRSNHLLIKLEDINTPEEAFDLTNKSIFMTTSDISVDIETSTNNDHSDFIGMTIYDVQEKVTIGMIENIISFPQQDMALINYKNKEILIPFVAAFIIDIDLSKNQINMSLPKGLLDL